MRRFAIAAWLGSVGACVRPSGFVCTDDAQCRVHDDGRCLASNCVVTDAECASGERYSEWAAPALAGECVTAAAGSDDGSGSVVGTEVCNGIDDDGDGLVDEWAPGNTECELCDDGTCYACFTFVDDEQNPARTYTLCNRDNYVPAQATCDRIGSVLVTIADDQENTRLAIEIAGKAAWNHAYIGLRDFADGDTPQWTWIDGTPLGYHRLGEYKDAHPPDDDCVMLQDDGTWLPNICNGGAAFICAADVR